jgi:hypothetical protein
MRYDAELANLSAAKMVGWGLGLITIGGFACAVALVGHEQGTPWVWVAVWALAAAAGWVMLGVGAIRLAEKVDHLYRASEPSTTRTP